LANTAELKSIRGRSASAIHAACLYIACRQEDRPRTFKEICSVARDTNTREIGRCFNFILKALNEKLQNELNKHTLRPGDLLRRYCSSLGLPNEVIRAVLVRFQQTLVVDACVLCEHIEYHKREQQQTLVVEACVLCEHIEYYNREQQ
jgi:transcription initiation factor TFIIB